MEPRTKLDKENKQTTNRNRSAQPKKERRREKLSHFLEPSQREVKRKRPKTKVSFVVKEGERKGKDFNFRRKGKEVVAKRLKGRKGEKKLT
jgi:hypothetical protein